MVGSSSMGKTVSSGMFLFELDGLGAWVSKGCKAIWSTRPTTVGTTTWVNDLTISWFASREETVAK